MDFLDYRNNLRNLSIFRINLLKNTYKKDSRLREKMYELIKESINSDESALELAKAEKDVGSVVDAISELSLEETMKLGTRFKKFPIGCDLTEVVVGTCASDLEKMELFGNCMLANMIGAPIHICAYAFSDIAEKYGQRGVEIMEEVYNITDVPLDLDHFGKYGAMRLPKHITGCGGDCYNKGPSFTECPRGRIHERLIDKEKAEEMDKEKWVQLSSSVAINLSSEQSHEGHAAPLEEAEDLANLAKKYGKGLEAIMFVGDGYDELITGFSKAIEMGVDVFVIEGGPFNRCENTNESFAKAIAMSRILCPGKVVATNGAYESECRAGLRSGLNVIITGFPKNHHGYMCGFEPGTARRGKFGLPRVIEIMNEEIKAGPTRVPVQREELLALTHAVKLAGPENIYPKTIGSFTVGDAHWATIQNSKMYKEMHLPKTLDEIANSVNGSTVSLHGGRFVSWLVAKELDKKGVEEIIITDSNPWIEKVTVDNLQEELNATVIKGHADDESAGTIAKESIVTTTIPQIHNAIRSKIPHAVNII